MKDYKLLSIAAASIITVSCQQLPESTQSLGGEITTIAEVLPTEYTSLPAEIVTGSCEFGAKSGTSLITTTSSDCLAKDGVFTPNITDTEYSLPTYSMPVVNDVVTLPVVNDVVTLPATKQQGYTDPESWLVDFNPKTYNAKDTGKPLLPPSSWLAGFEPTGELSQGYNPTTSASNSLTSQILPTQ